MSMFSSLRVRNYRLFASGQAVSLTGSWMQRVAQDWLVVQLSHGSGTALGITTGLQFLPLLLLSLYGGTLADRHSKRRILLFTQTAMGLLAGVLAILDFAGVVSLWQVFVLAFALGIATAVDTPTRQAWVVELVGREQITNAVSLNSATFNTARIIGPAVAGLLIEKVGTATVFALNAASFLAVIVGLLMIREAELHSGVRQPKRAGQLREGLAYVRARPELYLPLVLVGVIGTLGMNFQMTLALMARDVFHRQAGSYGLLSTMLAVGALGGALHSARRPRPRQRLLVWSGIAFGALETLTALMPSYDWLMVMLVPTGVAMLILSTAANSTMQLGTSAAMRGRVMALYSLVFMGGTPIGAPLVGWIGQVSGARYSLLVGGLASTVAGLAVGYAWLRRSEPRLTLATVMPWREPELAYNEARSRSVC
ncbi:MAG: MFS transporter [Mycobacteriales bacterium]